MVMDILSAFSIPYVVAVCGFISLVIYRLNLLTARGTFSAFMIAVFIWVSRGVEWLAVLLFFFAVGSAATKWRYGQKREEGTAEARRGRRSIENVIGSAYSPLLFLVFSSPLGFLASVSAALADTLASEVGTLSHNVRLITNLKRVEPGTNGGVSLFGEFVSLIGAMAVAASAPLLGITDPALLVLITFSGFMGAQFDSLLGATLENREVMGKTEVNIASTFLAGALILVLVYFGLDSSLAPHLPSSLF